MIRLLYFLSCYFLVQTVVGQKLELGKVTVEELSQKKHDKDTSAVAAILFKKAKTKFKFSKDNEYECFTEVELKVKIFKKEGLDFGSFKIPFYVGYESIEDEVVQIEVANTYNLENGEIIKSKVTNVGKKQENVNEYWKTKVVFFSNVKVGSVLELKYIIKTQNLSVLPDFQYQYDIPVNYAQYISNIPEFYIYKTIKNGMVSIDFKESIENTSSTFNDKYSNRVTIYHKSINSIYTAENIPALLDESFIINKDNYYAKIELELKTIRMPEKEPKQVSQTWKDVALSIFEEKYFGKEIEKSSYFIDDLKRIIKSSDNPKEKMDIVFKFVQGRMNWNGFNNYVPKQILEKAYMEKVGNSAEINLILIAMLKMAGLNVDPVIMSTKNNGIALFPNRSKINYLIAATEIDNEIFLLDATSKFSSSIILPLNSLNWVGQRISKTGETTEIDLMPNKISNKIVTALCSIDLKGNLTGKIREQYFDYNALKYRNTNNNLSKEVLLEKLEKKYNKILLKDYSIENINNLEKPIIESYSFEANNVVDVINDKIYFNPLFFFIQNVNHFKQEKRNWSVDFLFPNRDKYNLTVNIPEGYVVEYLPEVITIKFSENQLIYKFNISSNNNVINISSVLDINTSVISNENYEELKVFYNEMIKKQTEKVVLKKM